MFAKWLGIPLFVVFLGLLALSRSEPAVPNRSRCTFGGFTRRRGQEIGRALFTTYLLPFEVTSILILIAIIGAVVLARKEID